MEKFTLNVTNREGRGKGPARAMRRDGSVPCVVYKKGDSRAITVNRRELRQFIKSAAGNQVLVNLKFSENEEKPVLVKEYQSDPVMGDILHVDFYEVSLTEKLRLTVRVVTLGEPIGVKQDGGLLQHGLREIEIECLPNNIIGKAQLDVTGIALGSSMHVSDLDLGDDIKILTDPKTLLASVVAPKIEETPTEEEEAVEGEEGAEAAEGEEGEEAKKDKDKSAKEEGTEKKEGA